jgi:hypothetical protein
MNSEEAEQKAEQWKREGEARLQQRTETIHVKVDNDAITETMNENKKLKQEIEEGKDAKALYDDMCEKAALQLTNLGIQTEPDDIKSNKDLSRSIDTIKALQARKTGNQTQIPSGCVPLSSQQPSSNPHAFGDYNSLVDSIRDRCSAQNPDKEDRKQAQAVLDKLMEKAIRGQKESLKPFNYEMPADVSLSEMLNAKYQRRKKLGKGE